MTIPIIVVPGTFWKDVASWAETYSLANKPMQAIAKIFGTTPILFDWSGANSANERHAAAEKLAEYIQKHRAYSSLTGLQPRRQCCQSEAAAHLSPKVDLLITIATPVTGNYKTGGARRHIHLYSPQDRMQILGGEGLFGIPARAEREFPGATNVAIDNILEQRYNRLARQYPLERRNLADSRNATLTFGLKTRVCERRIHL